MVKLANVFTRENLCKYYAVYFARLSFNSFYNVHLTFLIINMMIVKE